MAVFPCKTVGWNIRLKDWGETACGIHPLSGARSCPYAIGPMVAGDSGYADIEKFRSDFLSASAYQPLPYKAFSTKAPRLPSKEAFYAEEYPQGFVTEDKLTPPSKISIADRRSLIMECQAGDAASA